MSKIQVLRNDDVAADTSLAEIRTFCEICDRYGVTPLHAITPIGEVRRIDCKWDNRLIRQMSGTALFSENQPVVEYLRGRKSDMFAVHGLWHTHLPSSSEIRAAWELISACDLFSPVMPYYVPPFNEGAENDCPREFTFCGRECPRLEEYLESGDPQAEIVYVHSWRFADGGPGPFRWEQLDRCLARLTAR